MCSELMPATWGEQLQMRLWGYHTVSLDQCMAGCSHRYTSIANSNVAEGGVGDAYRAILREHMYVRL